jgi:drug/metabolite transporter (DMT)-like permease
LGLSSVYRGDDRLGRSAVHLFQATRLALIVATEAEYRDHPLLGILCKSTAALLFSMLFASIRWLGPDFPVGEIVFFRSVFGIPVIVVTALMMGGPRLLVAKRIDTHAGRSIAGAISMYFNFASYALLPLADATAISFASPLFVVILAATMLHERVHLYRWSAVIVGFIGVMVIIGSPQATMNGAALRGALYALAGAALTALAMIYLRRMSAREHSITIAFYYMIATSVFSLFTIPFGWIVPSRQQAYALVFCGLAGGAGQLFLSFSYRYSEASAVAPFDYTAMIWAVLIGYFVFMELPGTQVWLGSIIVIACGLMIFWRERKLERERGRSLQRWRP